MAIKGGSVKRRTSKAQSISKRIMHNNSSQSQMSNGQIHSRAQATIPLEKTKALTPSLHPRNLGLPNPAADGYNTAIQSPMPHGSILSSVAVGGIGVEDINTNHLMVTGPAPELGTLPPVSWNNNDKAAETFPPTNATVSPLMLNDKTEEDDDEMN